MYGRGLWERGSNWMLGFDNPMLRPGDWIFYSVSCLCMIMEVRDVMIPIACSSVLLAVCCYL